MSDRCIRRVVGFVVAGLLAMALPAMAAGALSVEVINGYNLVVDSNVTAPSTYGPAAAYIGTRICNTGNAPIDNVIAYTGNYNGGVGSTPGTFPVRSSTGDAAHPQINNTGNYSLTLESGSDGSADATRYLGTLAAGECRVVYWLISYPQCVNVANAPDSPPCAASIAGGVSPVDDVSLNYDIWATTTTAIAPATVNVRRSFTMRNEISAAANKIWPNTTSKVPDAYLAAIQSILGWGTLGPDGQPLTPSNPVYPGQRVITSQGIWYDLGNVGQGFDNDGDLVPDQNAWLQPVGDAGSFDAGCFRLVNVYGILVVKLKSGGELLIPFQNELYFEHLPENTGAVGLVYYQFIATDQGCSASMTPYQEAASGFDNEKFSADFGLSNGLTSGSFGANLSFTKTDGLATTTVGSTLTYTASIPTNTTGVPLGAPDYGVPLVIKETIPTGTSFVANSADDNPTNNLAEPTGTGSYSESYTDINGQLDTCTINYNITSSSWVILYSNNNGSTWSLTEPAGVTNIQWMLYTTIAKDGYHDGTACVLPNGSYDNGTLSTSLPPGKTASVSFQVTVGSSVGPVVCNTALLGFGSASATTAQDCTLVSGNNALGGTIFKDDGSGGGTYGNGTKDNVSEAGIGAGVLVSLYYDFDGDGQLGSADIIYGTTTTSASGTYSFSNLPDGPFLVVAKKYDAAASNDATDTTYGTTGYGNTSTDPQLSLTTNQGVLRMHEDTTTVTLAVNIDLARSNPVGQTPFGGTPTAPALGLVNFGFAPPLRLTKTVGSNPDSNADGRADTAIDEGDTFTYSLLLENRLPSVGVQGPTGCQYTAWATTGANGTPASKEFTNPANAWDGPNRSYATTVVSGGGLNFMDGTGFSLRTQAGSITKVEALYFGYFSQALTDDNLTLTITQGFNSNSTTMGTALIDSYIGEPASLDPNNAISWDVTAVKPGGGTWSFADNFSTLRLMINPSKASNADQKTFFLDAIGVRITTDQACVAGASTTLSPVPLQDSYDTGSVAFVSSSPAADSVNTGTGIIQWNDVGPILPGSSQTVTVTMRALNVTGTRTGTCGGSSPPTLNSACNWAETAWGSNHVYYADGRQANDGSSKIAIQTQGKGELRGVLWNDLNNDGWPDNDGEARLPNISVTLWGCVQSSGAMETTSNNKTCANTTNGNSWQVIKTTTSDSSGAYEFIGLDTGFYLIEVNNTDSAPAGGNTAPYGGTRTAEPTDTNQPATAGVATGANGVCPAGCNSTWGWGASEPNTNALNLINSPTSEEVIGGINFGFYIPNAVLYGNIWWDINASTTQNAGEGGLSGFTVQRYSDPNGDGNPADGTLQATTTTDSNGNYSFSGLAAGSYVIVVTPPTLLSKTWVETVESTGGTGSLNNQIPVTVSAGQISGSHNFGYTQSDTSDIGDTVFYDFDADGVQDATETGIANITVWLYEDVDRDGTIDSGVDNLLATTSTNGTGQYLFSNYPAGSYVVKVDTSDVDFPSDMTPSADPDIAAASIGDQIWYDNDGNATKGGTEDGIARVVVYLYADTDSSGTLNGADTLVASTITNANGNYLFTGLTKGSYFVDVDESTLPSTALVITTVDPANTLITLSSSSSATQVLTADAGYSPSSNFAIGNRIWHDVDNDGVQDPGEPGIPDITVTVTNGTGTGCASGCTATTNAAGFWIVTGLTNGTFTVDVNNADPDFPRDFTATTGTTDPRVITVASADRTDIDFGYRYTGTGSSPTGTISGRVFLDADGDLAYDVGEARSGTTVNLLDGNGDIVATTTTAADGTYSFTGIFVGTYSVQSVDRLGTFYSTIFLNAAQTFPNLNVIYRSTIETVADSQASVSIDGVHNDLRADFGYRRFLASIGDSVYWDINENGTQDAGEQGFSGVTVRLYDSVWTDSNGDGFYQAGESTDSLVATTVTIADDPLTAANEGGTYLFSNLSTLANGHKYKVVVDTTTIPGTTKTLIADPDTDGTPCTALTVATNPPSSVCDSQHLITGFLPGNNYLGADFGYRITGSGFATIGDQLWIDSDGDGVRDGGEVGIDAVTVWLDTDNDGVIDWTDANANGVWDSGEGERWTVTDPDGQYYFGSVTDGAYNLKVLTSDSDWPSGLPTTPTFEVRSGNTASLNNAVIVTVSGGVVTIINDGDPGTTDTCSSCNLNVDFGYRWAGTNALSGTVCTDDATKNGYCGNTATTYTGVGTGESAIEGIQITAYRWTDDGDGVAWTGSVLDAGDTFQLIGTASTNSLGDYSFSNLPNDVVLVFSVAESQYLDLTTTNANTSVEDANVTKSGLYEGTTTTVDGFTVTVVGRQALKMAGDTDDNIKDVDYAFDPTLNGTLVYDYGDLATSYAMTLLSNSGAQHKVTVSSIHMGSTITTESDGTESPTASADGGDDGVTLVSTTFGMGGAAIVNVNASAAGWVVAWLDFNGDGDFDDANEKIIDQAVTAGDNQLWFTVSNTIPNGLTDFFSRFRIYPARPQIVASTGPGLDSNFQRMSGEVEDYVFSVSVSPTLVKIRKLDAVQSKNNVTVMWQTSYETDNAGFHVWRSGSDGVKTKLNAALITGSAFLTSNGRKTDHPYSYRFVDKAPLSGFAQYWVEDVDLHGTHTMNGPVTPTTSTSDVPGSGVTTDPDATLGSVGGVFTTEAGMGVNVPEPAAPAAAQLAEQWQLASVPAVKVIVTKPGWYRVTKAELSAAGFDAGTNGKQLAVWSDGIEIPVYVNAKNEAKFDATDSIEFFGRGIDIPSTGGRVYYITARKGSGLRVKTTGNRGNSGSPAPATFPYTFTRFERFEYFPALVTNGDNANFFGSAIGTWGVEQSMSVTNPDRTGTAKLETVIQGATDWLQHVAEVKLNGTTIGEIHIGPIERHVETLEFPASLLVPGNNTLYFVATNSDDDISLIESLKLNYAHTLRADNDALTLSVAPGTAVTITGFTNDKVRVVDVTNPSAPDFIDANVGNAADGSKQVSFVTTNQGNAARTIFAFADNRVMPVAQVVWNEPSTWNATSNGANLVIITNKQFIAAANALKAARVAQGISTAVVDVQNVYDEFSFGHHSPQAIRDFLYRAYTTWTVKPHYAILLGDASFDPRNYMNMGSFDYVPSKEIPTYWTKTASDDWFADFAGSGVPAIAIGRIPVRTAAEATATINKLVARTGPPTDAWAKNVEIISAGIDGYNFGRAADLLAEAIPKSYTVDRIRMDQTPSPASAIDAAFDRGSVLTTYLGHGSVEMWGWFGYTAGEASALTNSNRLPFVLAMTCGNGYFQNVWAYTMAEAMLNNPNGGAIGVLASSALTNPSGQVTLAGEFDRLVFGSSPMTVGDAVLKAKEATRDQDVRRTFILFGDPTIRLK